MHGVGGAQFLVITLLQCSRKGVCKFVGSF